MEREKQWEQEQWDLKQELGEEYYKTYDIMYNMEDKEWVLEDQRLREEEEIAKKNFLMMMEEEEQEQDGSPRTAPTTTSRKRAPRAESASRSRRRRRSRPLDNLIHVPPRHHL